MRTAAVWTSVILDTAFHGHDTNQAADDQLHAAGVNVKWAPNDVIYQLSGGLTLEARVMGDGPALGNARRSLAPTNNEAPRKGPKPGMALPQPQDAS